jgi:hypothetical protein
VASDLVQTVTVSGHRLNFKIIGYLKVQFQTMGCAGSYRTNGKLAQIVGRPFPTPLRAQR